MITIHNALYARVSSVKQAQAGTVLSQIAALEKRIADDGGEIPDDNKFIDNGYSGSTLVRPALERLRDQLAQGDINKLYVHSPDRLSRKYAYQMILLEEFKALGVEVVFLNFEVNDNPESQLLVQMQGMIAEYERAKIMERNRRGKIHCAKRGSVNVLGTAPYGYRYIDKHTGGGQASLEINDEEAITVRNIFSWMGRDRMSIGEVCRRLDNEGIPTQKGKKHWDRSVIWAMLKNPAYKGEAAFGKTKTGKILPQIRPQKHATGHPKKGYSVYPVEENDWITIPVPAITSQALFEVVQEQLAQNRKTARTRRRGASYLLQGLVVCARCQYAFYGKPVRNKRGDKIVHYAYYRCIGTDGYRFGGQKVCDNKQLRTDALEVAVWDETVQFLENPNCVLEEYRRRLSNIDNSPLDQERQDLDKLSNKIQKGINRLIDSYTDGYLSKTEFEPRVKGMKERLSVIESQRTAIVDRQTLEKTLQNIVTNLASFASQVNSSLSNIDWETKRLIIRTLVKRVEINLKEVNVVFKINPPPEFNGNSNNNQSKSLQDCCRGKRPALWNTFSTLTIKLVIDNPSS
jgi:site-specific DNA recombinase